MGMDESFSAVDILGPGQERVVVVVNLLLCVCLFLDVGELVPHLAFVEETG